MSPELGVGSVDFKLLKIPVGLTQKTVFSYTAERSTYVFPKIKKIPG